MAYLPNWEPILDAPPDVYYWQTHIAGDGVWYAVGLSTIGPGADAHIIRSSDEGQTWSEITSIPSSIVDGGICSSSDGAIVYAFSVTEADGISADGKIYQSTDHGLTFTGLAGTENQRWMSICCSADGAKIYCIKDTLPSGPNSIISVSTDSGDTWSDLVIADSSLLFINCSADATKIIAANNDDGTNGAFLSLDSGLSFASVGTPGRYRGACVSPDGTVIYLGKYGGDILKSTDDGDNWSVVLDGLDLYWGSFCCSEDGSKIVATSNYAVYTSEDSGATWFKVYEDDFASISANITLALSPANDVVFIGDDGQNHRLLKGFFLTNPDLSCCCTKWLTQYVPGQPTASQRMAYHAIPLAVTVPQGFAGSKAVCVTGPDAAITYSIKNASDDEVGTITFATGETTGTFTGPAALSLAAGDTLSVFAPSVPDASQADIAITLVAVCEGNDPPVPSACCNSIRVDMTATATLGVRLTNIPRPRVQFNARAVTMGRLTNA